MAMFEDCDKECCIDGMDCNYCRFVEKKVPCEKPLRWEDCYRCGHKEGCKIYKRHVEKE